MHPLRPLYFCPAMCAPKTPPALCVCPAHTPPPPHPSAHQTLPQGAVRGLLALRTCGAHCYTGKQAQRPVFWGRGPFGQTTFTLWQTMLANHRPLWHAARVNVIIQRTGEAGIATIPSHCLRFHIHRMSHSHKGRSTLHVYTAEGGEGGDGDNLQF